MQAKQRLTLIHNRLSGLTLAVFTWTFYPSYDRVFKVSHVNVIFRVCYLEHCEGKRDTVVCIHLNPNKNKINMVAPKSLEFCLLVMKELNITGNLDGKKH